MLKDVVCALKMNLCAVAPFFCVAFVQVHVGWMNMQTLPSSLVERGALILVVCYGSSGSQLSGEGAQVKGPGEGEGPQKNKRPPTNRVV